jgi:hypothetical protein
LTVGSKFGLVINHLALSHTDQPHLTLKARNQRLSAIYERQIWAQIVNDRKKNLSTFHIINPLWVINCHFELIPGAVLSVFAPSTPNEAAYKSGLHYTPKNHLAAVAAHIISQLVGIQRNSFSLYIPATILGSIG